MIDLRDLTLLGSDYARSRDYYLDARTGAVYVAEPVMEVGSGHVRLRSQTLRALTPGVPHPHRDGFDTFAAGGQRTSGAASPHDLAA